MIMWRESQFLLENQFLGKYKMQLIIYQLLKVKKVRPKIK